MFYENKQKYNVFVYFLIWNILNLNKSFTGPNIHIQKYFEETHVKHQTQINQPDINHRNINCL